MASHPRSKALSIGALPMSFIIWRATVLIYLSLGPVKVSCLDKALHKGGHDSYIEWWPHFSWGIHVVQTH